MLRGIFYELQREKQSFTPVAEAIRRVYRFTVAYNFYKPDFDLSAICNTLCISRATLHRCFVKVCGAPPGAYLTKYRLDRAKDFLERGFSVKSTALSCGFSDSLYFSKVFKASVGVSPAKYGKAASFE